MRSPSLAVRRQRGAAMVEFAVVVPILLMLIFYGTFFHDAIRTKLRVQEAARFGAWEFTAFPLSNYSNDGKAHDTLFNQAKTAIKGEIADRYGAFDSSRPVSNNPPLTDTFIGIHTLLTADDKLTFSNSKVDMADPGSLGDVPGIGGVASELSGLAGNGISMIDGLFKFNENGLVSVTVTGQMENKIIPTAFLEDRFHVDILPAALKKFEMSDHVALIADPWTLHQGKDANLANAKLKGSEIAGANSPHPFSRQVGKMKFMGVSGLIPGGLGDALSTIENYFPGDIVDPFFDIGATIAPVASLNYRHSAVSDDWGCTGTSNDAPKHGMISLSKHGRRIDVGVDCFQTLPVRTTFAYKDTTLWKTYMQSGKNYMHCVKEQADDYTADDCAFRQNP